MTWGGEDEGDGACAPSWRYRAEWIPAYAGMTVQGGNDGKGGNDG